MVRWMGAALAAGMVATAASGAELAAATKWQVVDLGIDVHPTALNNKGTIVGYQGYDWYHAPGLLEDFWPWLAQPSTIMTWTQAGGWQARLVSGQEHAAPSDIDDAGNIVGAVLRTPDDGWSRRAFYLPKNSASMILFPDADHDSWARRLVDGQVGGTSDTFCADGGGAPCAGTAATAWQPRLGTWTTHAGSYWGGTTYLGSSGTSLDTTGRVYGNRGYNDGPNVGGPAWWEVSLAGCAEGRAAVCAAPDRNPDTIYGGNVEAVNRKLHAVGWTQHASTGTQALMWDVSDPRARTAAPRVLTGPGTAGDTEVYAFAINDQDQVVGRGVKADGTWHAIAWTKSTGTVDLVTATGLKGWKLETAWAINNSGWILATGYAPGEFFKRTVLLTPH